MEEDAAYSTSVEALMSRLSEMEEQVRQLNEANRTLGKRNEDLECEVISQLLISGQKVQKTWDTFRAAQHLDSYIRL